MAWSGLIARLGIGRGTSQRVPEPPDEPATCRETPSSRRPARGCTRCRIQYVIEDIYLETVMREDLITAVEAAIHGDWEKAHGLVQKHEADPTACWIHAVLHKMEPDEANARYWYRKAGQFLESYGDPVAELTAIKAALTY